jgi:hypothetical protein
VTTTTTVTSSDGRKRELSTEQQFSRDEGRKMLADIYKKHGDFVYQRVALTQLPSGITVGAHVESGGHHEDADLLRAMRDETADAAKTLKRSQARALARGGPTPSGGGGGGGGTIVRDMPTTTTPPPSSHPPSPVMPGPTRALPPTSVEMQRLGIKSGPSGAPTPPPASARATAPLPSTAPPPRPAVEVFRDFVTNELTGLLAAKPAVGMFNPWLVADGILRAERDGSDGDDPYVPGGGMAMGGGGSNIHRLPSCWTEAMELDVLRQLAASSQPATPDRVRTLADAFLVRNRDNIVNFRNDASTRTIWAT